MKFWGGTLNKKIELSIIVPVYNVEKYLGECLDSILKIKNINYELLIINDGSPDNSQKIIDEYCKKSNRIKSFIKENGGLSSARNYGLERASGEYIWFVDSDDLVVAPEFEKFYKKAKELKDIDIICGNYNSFMDGNRNDIIKSSLIIKELDKSITGIEFLEILEKNLTHNCPVWKNLYKIEFIKKNNLYFEEGVIFEDYIYTILSLIKSEKVVFFDISFYLYREKRKGSIMTELGNSKDKILKASYRMCKVLPPILKNKNLKVLNKDLIKTYISYLNDVKIRDLVLEKQLWELKIGIFFKLKEKFKIFKRTHIYHKYKIK